MLYIEIHTPDTAPDLAADTLQTLQENLGFVPNVFAAMAGTPNVLEAFVALNAKFAESSLTPTEREIVQIAASAENACEYCVAGHTAFATAQGVPRDAIEAARDGAVIDEPKLEALQTFVRAVVWRRGRLDPLAIDRLLSVGYAVPQVQEIILGICVKTFSNLTCNLFDIPLDAAFLPHSWDPETASVMEARQAVA